MPNNQLPPTAKQVFKGIIFDVYQWEQTMYDGSTATFERLQRPDTVNVIAVVGDKILILHQEQPDRSKPFTAIPGGRLDDGETPLAGAKRELHEEAGYISNDWELLQSYRPYNKIIWTIHTFIARDCKLNGAPHVDAGEKITSQLFSFGEFLMLSDDPTFQEKELQHLLLRARFIPEEKEKLRIMLFGK